MRAATLAAAGGGPQGVPAQLRVERSRRSGQGDYSTNAAMLLAPVLGSSPREVADQIGRELQGLLGEDLERVEVAGPGF